MIDKDHLVGQLTTVLPALFYLACACFSLHSPTANWMPLAITCLSNIHNPDHQALLIYLCDISLLFPLNQKCFSTQNNYDFVLEHQGEHQGVAVKLLWEMQFLCKKISADFWNGVLRQDKWKSLVWSSNLRMFWGNKVFAEALKNLLPSLLSWSMRAI